jgi:hypothetical protein
MGGTGFRLIVTFTLDEVGILSDNDGCKLVGNLCNDGCKLAGNLCNDGSFEPGACRRIVRGGRLCILCL